MKVKSTAISNENTRRKEIIFLHSVSNQRERGPYIIIPAKAGIHFHTKWNTQLQVGIYSQSFALMHEP